MKDVSAVPAGIIIHPTKPFKQVQRREGEKVLNDTRTNDTKDAKDNNDVNGQ